MTRAPWYVAGPALVLCILMFRAALNKPLSALGGYIDRADPVAGRRGRVSVWLLLGFVIGGALSAALTGTFSLSIVYPALAWPVSPSLQIALLVAAGIAMGLGARASRGAACRDTA